MEPKPLRAQFKKNNTNYECKIRHDYVGLGRGCSGEESWASVSLAL